jgi:hypothetical protein
MARGICLAAILAMTLVAGCGDDEPSSAAPDPGRAAPLSAPQRAAADRAVDSIRAYCRGLARFLAGRRAGRPPLGEALAAARSIATLARQRPGAPYSGSQTARDLAADLAEDLEGTNCSNTLVAELAAGLRTNRFP